MKLKTIATIFKRNKFLRIWNEPNGAQWITNGVAAYSMEGMTVAEDFRYSRGKASRLEL